MTTTVRQWPTNRLLLSAPRLALALLMSNLAVRTGFSSHNSLLRIWMQILLALIWGERLEFLKCVFFIYLFLLHYSALLYLPPLIFYCFWGCRDRFQDYCDSSIDIQTLQPLGWISSTKARSEPRPRHGPEAQNGLKTGNIPFSARGVSWSLEILHGTTKTYLQ